MTPFRREQNAAGAWVYLDPTEARAAFVLFIKFGVDLGSIDDWVEAAPHRFAAGDLDCFLEWRGKMIHAATTGNDSAAEAWGLLLTKLMHANRRIGFLKPLARFAQPFVQKSGRGEGPVKKLVREVLGPLEKRLRREASHLEVWQACAARRHSGISFENDPTWGTPVRAVPANGGRPAKWSRFQVIVSEVRGTAKK